MQEHNSNDDKVVKLFQRVSDISFDPPPYLKTRVLGELAERRRRGRALAMWRWLGTGSSVLAALAMVWMFFPTSSAFQAVAGKPFVVRVEMEALDQYRITHAQIELPAGVRFYSESFPQLSEQGSLTLAWNEGIAKGQFPFVIRAEKAGKGTVVVRFLDKNKAVVAERRLEIKFEAGESKES